MPVQPETPHAGFRPAVWGAQWGLDVRVLRAVSVMAGGAVGALARGALAEALPAHGEWPWGTFVANQLGALLLAWLSTELAETVVPTRFWRPLLGTGLCGSLTTFSLLQVETIRIVRDGHPGLAAAYAVVSVAAGMVCAVGGTMYARRTRYG
jgi:fluoride exporter